MPSARRAAQDERLHPPRLPGRVRPHPREDPEAQILHVAYSAVTTCSLASAEAAAEGRDYVATLDTRHVTIGQGLVVRELAAWLAAHPEATLDEARAHAEGVAARTRMAFLPGDLGYLRAGGRLSNVAFLGATLLKIKPVVELVDGRLVATKKLRGSMSSAAVALVDYLALREEFDPARIVFVKSPGLPEQVAQTVEGHARDLGFERAEWYETGNVITSHCGPGASRRLPRPRVANGGSFFSATAVPEIGRFPHRRFVASENRRPSPMRGASCAGNPAIPGHTAEKVGDSGTRSSRQARNPAIPGRRLRAGREGQRFPRTRRSLPLPAGYNGVRTSREEGHA